MATVLAVACGGSGGSGSGRPPPAAVASIDEATDVDGLEFMPVAPWGEWNGWLTCVTFDDPGMRDAVQEALAEGRLDEARELLARGASSMAQLEAMGGQMDAEQAAALAARLDQARREYETNARLRRLCWAGLYVLLVYLLLVMDDQRIASLDSWRPVVGCEDYCSRFKSRGGSG